MNQPHTPLPEVDTQACREYWEQFRAAAQIPVSTPLPDHVGCFGDSVELADELLGLILHGPKRATAGSAAEYEAEGLPTPSVGMYSIATDGRGLPAAVLVTTDVRIGPLSSCSEEFAWDEGEGDRSLKYWMDAHTKYFKRALGDQFHPDIEVVFERFEVTYPVADESAESRKPVENE